MIARMAPIEYGTKRAAVARLRALYGPQPFIQGYALSYQFTAPLDLVTAAQVKRAPRTLNLPGLATYLESLAGLPGALDTPHAVYLGIEYSPCLYLLAPEALAADALARAESIKTLPDERDVTDSATLIEREAGWRPQYGIPPLPFADSPLVAPGMAALRLWWD